MEPEMLKEVTALVHKYGLQEVRTVVEARYQAAMRDVGAFVSDLSAPGGQ